MAEIESASPSPDAQVVKDVAPEVVAAADAEFSRRDMLRLGGIGALALSATLLTNMPSAQALAPSDTRALRFLEEVEILQCEFFQRAAASAAAFSLKESEREVIFQLAEQDREHKEWFRLARTKMGVAEFGGFYTPNTSQSRPPRLFNFPAKVFSSRQQMFPFALRLKETATGAYHGLVATARQPEIIEALAALAGVEGRHAAALRQISGLDPAPTAFEPALSPEVVMNRLSDFAFKANIN